MLWGSTYLGIRVTVETIPPLLMSGMRFLAAGAILFAWRFPIAMKNGALPDVAQWRRCCIIGIALMLGGNGGVAWAEQTVPSGVAALIVATVPLWMALIDRIFYGKRLMPLTIVGLLGGFGAIALLAVAPAGGAVPLAGAAVLLVAALSWAFGSIYSRVARLPDDLLLSTGMEMLCGGVVLCLAALISGEFGRFAFERVGVTGWIAFWYLVLLGGIVGFSAYLWLMRAAPTALVSTYAYVNPIVAVILGTIVLHEQLTPKIVATALIIVCSVALIVSQNARSGVEQLVRRKREKVDEIGS